MRGGGVRAGCMPVGSGRRRSGIDGQCICMQASDSAMVCAYARPAARACAGIGTTCGGGGTWQTYCQRSYWKRRPLCTWNSRALPSHQQSFHNPSTGSPSAGTHSVGVGGGGRRSRSIGTAATRRTRRG